MVTTESRSALSRANFFLTKARACPASARIDFEAYLEAAIVFARAAVHRLQKKQEGNPAWKDCWNALRSNEAVNFFRTERDWLLKEAPPKIGQKVFAASIGSSTSTDAPALASGFYYYETPDIPATDTVAKHLQALEQTLREAEERLGGSEG